MDGGFKDEILSAWMLFAHVPARPASPLLCRRATLRDVDTLSPTLLACRCNVRRIVEEPLFHRHQ
jgi:hypothetical protein